MAYERDFDDYMPDTITIEPFSSYDEYRARSFGVSVTYTARVTEEFTQVMDLNGLEQTSTHTVWIAPHATSGLPTGLTTNARVTLPDGSTPPLLSYRLISDDEGDHHMKLMLGPVRG